MVMDESTEEWVLWTHKCNKHMSKSQWNESTMESSHFFAHHDNKTEEQQPFVCNLDHLPLPSRTFFQKGQHCKAPQKHVEYSVFKKNVFPKWEDASCHGEWYTKHFFPANVLDDYWIALVEGVMSGKIDSQYIAGIRVVDKSHSKHPLYRLELWLNNDVQQNRDKVRDQAMKCITMDSHYAFKFHWRKFADLDHSKQNQDSDHEEGATVTTTDDQQDAKDVLSEQEANKPPQ